MAITVKKVDRNVKLTFWERLYIMEVLRGMGITLRHFFGNMAGFFAELAGGPKKRRIMTIYYPEEKPTPPPAYRGRPVLVARPDGVEKCVACGLCEAVCPARCITIVGGERENGERYPKSYILDGSRCIFCGFCEEACPKEAIVMSDEWTDICEYDRSRMIYDKKALLRSERELQKRLDVIRKRYFSKDTYR